MEPVRIRVLGSLQLGGDRGPLRSGRLRRLLAALLVQHGTVVSTDRLAQLLWGDGQPTEPAAALQTLVWRLREALRAAGCDGAARLLTRAPGYLLDVDGEQVDVVRFERLVRSAGSQPPDRAAALLEEALSLWRGSAYAEFADDEFARAEAARLEDLRLAAGSDWVDAVMALDRPGDTLGRLAALVAADPLRERPRAQLMRALHRLGQTADALQTFRDYRNLLANELGLDPSPTLRDLEAVILRQNAERDRTSPAAGIPGPQPPPAGNLRLELTDLIGRTDDVAAALATLDEARVLTLTGVGGVGKTRLALRVAADAQPRYRDGAWLCELAGVRDATVVPDVVATTLGVQQRQGLTVTDRLIEYLRPRRLLLLLDNCEHVLDAAAALADALVRGCPDLKVLATSREPLGTDGERVLPVQPLPVPVAPAAISGDVSIVAAMASVALFWRRAASASPAFVLTDDNVAAVAEICRRLDGLPLAIELAATRVPSLSPQEIADRLERRLQFLRSGRRIREERHRTLASVVDWSYRLLSPLEQVVFERCSVFMGAFSLDAAVSVTGGAEPEVTDSVAALVDKSMLVAQADTAPTRYTMLETLRAYGRQQLAERGEDAAACLAHACYHVELAEAAAIGLVGAEEATWADALAAAFDDLRSTHQWVLVHQPALAMRLSAALFLYGEAGAPSEIHVWAARAADKAPQDPLLPIVLAAAAGARFSGDLAGAAALAQRALDVVAQDDPVRRYPLCTLADVALFEGRLAHAGRLYTAAADLAGDAGDAYLATFATVGNALSRAYQGDTRTAAELADRAKQLAKAIANPTALAWADYALGEALLDQEPDRARQALDRAVAAARAARNRFVLGVALVSAGSLHTRHGDPQQAARLLGEAVDHWSQAGNWTQQWITLRHVIDLLIRLDAPEQAAVLYGALTASATATPAYGADADRLVTHAAVLRRELGADRFSAAVARGAALGSDGVVPFASVALPHLAPA
ncbi:MAG: winged helix-turn-helix domain-containing protein [Actinomycetota bacterium]|nr:winged helix-turn-helix domain-containing protein [Actinomycetota bacterium]